MAEYTKKGRTFGYTGHIPGLKDMLEVGATEYAQFEYTARNEPETLRKSLSIPPTQPETDEFHKYSGGATLSPNKYAPRTMIMGYQGHIPSMIQTYGVVNSDFQNTEILQRRGQQFKPIDYRRPDSQTQSRLVEQYRERAAQVQQAETQKAGAPQKTPSRPQSAARASSTPAQRISSAAQSPQPAASKDSESYKVEDYLAYSRALSFSGYIPRKKFMVGL